jgi:hypothetical protein
MSEHFAEAEMNVPRFLGATISHDHRSLIQPEDMARRWVTSVETARITLEEATTQRAVHNSRGYLGRRFKTQQHQLNHKHLAKKFYIGTLFPRITSLRGNTCAQLLCTSDGYSKVYTMKLKSDEGSKLNELCSIVGRNHAHGPAMCYKVLKPNGHFIVRSSCTPLTNADKNDPAVRDIMDAFTKDVDNIIGKFDYSYILEEDTADVEGLPTLNQSDYEYNLSPLDVDYEEIMDPLINAEIILPQGEGIALARVSKRKRSHDGSSSGHKNKKTLLDSRIYIVKCPDGEMKDVGFNI